jgi:hypothetical protein
MLGGWITARHNGKHGPSNTRGRTCVKRLKNHRTAARFILAAAMSVNLLAFPLASEAATYSYTDLNPIGFTNSQGWGISGSPQVGNASGFATGNHNHALLWSGTTSNALDLNPSGFASSAAYGISGSQQVGVGFGSATGNNDHALLWSGTASSAVDLNPSGFTGSVAYGTSGSQQVGAGYGPATGNNNHALLWSGTASSAVDLNPTGFTTSYAIGVSGTQQVGQGQGSATGNTRHALLWSGTASSVVDLHGFLSSDYTSSVAEGIDANGNIFGHAIHIPTGHVHAILWTIVPRLVISLAQREVALSWPASAPGFRLQSALNLNPPVNWIDSTNVPAIVGTQFMVTNAISGSNQFYRLKQ